MNNNKKQHQAYSCNAFRTAHAGRILAALLAGLLLSVSSLPARPGPASQATRPGKNIAFWQELYWRSGFGVLDLPVDQNGNTVVHNVAFLPIPSTPGDGTPGSLDVALRSGQRWTLPLLLLPGTSYTDGTPADPFVPKALFQTMEISVKVDGLEIVNTQNVMDFYYEADLDPVIPYDAPPINAIIWFQGLGLPVQNPMTPGTHSIQLDLRTTQALPAYFGGGFVEYHNTWTVTVSPGA